MLEDNSVMLAELHRSQEDLERLTTQLKNERKVHEKVLKDKNAKLHILGQRCKGLRAELETARSEKTSSPRVRLTSIKRLLA